MLGPEVEAWQPLASSILGFPESCWKLSVRDVAVATNITGEHCRFSSLGCTFQSNHLTFTKLRVLLPLQRARKARKSKAVEVLMPGPPFARVTWSWKERQSPPCCGPHSTREHLQALGGCWHTVRNKEGLEEELQALCNKLLNLKHCVCGGVPVVISCHAGEWSACTLQSTPQPKWGCRELSVLNLILNAVVGPPRLQDLTWSTKHVMYSWKKRFLQLTPCNLKLIIMINCFSTVAGNFRVRYDLQRQCMWFILCSRCWYYVTHQGGGGVSPGCLPEPCTEEIKQIR